MTVELKIKDRYPKYAHVSSSIAYGNSATETACQVRATEEAVFHLLASFREGQNVLMRA